MLHPNGLCDAHMTPYRCTQDDTGRGCATQEDTGTVAPPRMTQGCGATQQNPDGLHLFELGEPQGVNWSFEVELTP